MKSYILFTGGRESLINLHEENKRLPPEDSISLVLFDYGQKSFTKELSAARYYKRAYYFVTELKVFKVQMQIPEGIRTGVGSGDHVVARNLVFISYLLNHIGFEKARILIGTVKWRTKAYHDGLKKFRTDLHNIISKLYPNITLTSHTEQFFGTDTYRYLIEKGIDCSHLWVCMDNKRKPCGQCKKCRALENEIFSRTEDPVAQKFKLIYYGS